MTTAVKRANDIRDDGFQDDCEVGRDRKTYCTQCLGLFASFHKKEEGIDPSASRKCHSCAVGVGAAGSRFTIGFQFPI